MLDLSTVQILVLDEADRMLDMGFIHDVKKILALVPKEKQSLLFSATFSDEIRDLADDLLKNPQSIQVTPRNTTVQRITQVIHPVGRGKKKALLAHIIKRAQLEPGAGVHAHQVRRQQRGRIPDQERHRARWRCTATRARARAPRRWPASRAATSAPWWPPTSPPAASTSTNCRTSSTTRSPTSAKTTCTASAAPAAPATSGEAVSLVCLDEEGFMQEIERFTKQQIPVAGGRRLRPRSRRTRRADRHGPPDASGAARAGRRAAT